MSYDNFEISNQSGRPIALYTFLYGASYWRYCTADTDKTIGGQTYLARAISDEGVTQGGSDQNDLQIVMQKNLPVPMLFRNTQPSGKVWLTVRRWHIGDPANETPLLWSGTIVNATDVDEATVRLGGRSIGGSYDRNGLRLAWGRMCPHVLYSDFGCRVNKALHAYPRTLATVDGTSFTCTAHSDAEEGSFSGGFLEFVRDDGSLERKGIESQSGNHFVVLGSTSGLAIGSEVTIYPGCARNTTACKAFGNLPNYGGFPHLPGKSPFDGSPVF